MLNSVSICLSLRIDETDWERENERERERERDIVREGAKMCTRHMTLRHCR